VPFGFDRIGPQTAAAHRPYGWFAGFLAFGPAAASGLRSSTRLRLLAKSVLILSHFSSSIFSPVIRSLTNWP